MSRFRALQTSLACFAMLFLLPGDGAAFTEEELLGTWFVLIHYRNSETANPDADRWEDKIWTFEKRGSRLRWTEYPIVVFGDQTGRFERYRGVRSRVLAAWQPNSAQQAQIDGGLEINSRGSKSKSLRGTLAKGYKSTGRLRTQSASIIGYMENWSITGGPDKPVFARDDMMGSGRTENMEGRTEYATQEILDGGRLLRGLYERDGIRKGTFQMMRAGDVTRVAGKSEKVKEERRELFVEELQRTGFGVGVDRQGEDLPSSTSSALNFQKGMNLKQGLAALYHLPPEVNTQVLVRKLQVLRLGADGDEEIAYEDIESGKQVASADESYGVLAQLFCRGGRVSAPATVWQVYANNALVAWQTTIFREGCAFQQTVAPATLAYAGLEKRVTQHIGADFPESPVMKIALYRRALQTLREGRIADAEALLAKADAAVDGMAQGIAGSDRAAQRSRLSTTSDRDALRKQLVEAIALAKRGGGDLGDLAPDGVSAGVQERMVAKYMETLPAQEQMKLFRELQGRRKDVQARILQARIEELPVGERERLYREAVADDAAAEK